MFLETYPFHFKHSKSFFLKLEKTKQNKKTPSLSILGQKVGNKRIERPYSLSLSPEESGFLS